MAQKLLFICSRNKIRSLTAQKLYEKNSAYAVRSAGTQPSARIKVTEGLLRWADMVFFMEKAHLQRVQAKYPEALAAKRKVVLHIPDDYAFMQPELLEELESKLASHLEDGT